MTITIPLSEPLPGDAAFGESVTELRFRKPAGGDLRRNGFPLEDGEVNAARMAVWISDLSGLPPSAVDKLSIPDWMAAAEAVAGFFKASSPD